MRVRAEKVETVSNVMKYTYRDLKIGDRVRYPKQDGTEGWGIVIEIWKKFYTLMGEDGFKVTVWKDITTPLWVIDEIKKELVDPSKCENYGVGTSFPTGNRTYGGVSKSEAGMVSLGDGNYKSKEARA